MKILFSLWRRTDRDRRTPPEGHPSVSHGTWVTSARTLLPVGLPPSPDRSVESPESLNFP